MNFLNLANSTLTEDDANRVLVLDRDDQIMQQSFENYSNMSQMLCSLQNNSQNQQNQGDRVDPASPM